MFTTQSWILKVFEDVEQSWCTFSCESENESCWWEFTWTFRRRFHEPAQATEIPSKCSFYFFCIFSISYQQSFISPNFSNPKRFSFWDIHGYTNDKNDTRAKKHDSYFTNRQRLIFSYHGEPGFLFYHEYSLRRVGESLDSLNIHNNRGGNWNCMLRSQIHARRDARYARTKVRRFSSRRMQIGE